MRNIIIKHYNSSECTIILHACPNSKCSYQWYALGEDDKEEVLLARQVYESLTVNSLIINRLGLENKRVYCIIKQDDKEIRTNYIKLSSVFEKAMIYNKFDDISMFNKNGDIVPYM